MILSRVLARNTLLVALTTSSVAAFSASVGSTSRSILSRNHAPAFRCIPAIKRATTTTTTSTKLYASVLQDTPAILPEFANKEEYLTYMETVSDLPKGFAIGTADGKFVSVEAPLMGKLPIRGTVIHLPEGPSDNWAAVFTSNKVGWT